jgi:ribosomal protein S18 acetylase RimI-like enzyme
VTSVLRFETINLVKYWSLLISISQETYRASNASEERISELTSEDGQKRYRAFLQERIDTFPEGTVFAWLENEIVAQLSVRYGPKEFENYRMDEDEGYVNLFYVAPKHRGTFVADALDQYMVDYLTSKGCTWVRLTVNKDNARAVAYYKKRGWIDDGTRDEARGLRFMKRIFER